MFESCGAGLEACSVGFANWKHVCVVGHCNGFRRLDLFEEVEQIFGS